MEASVSTSVMEPRSQQHETPLRPNTVREKTKRPQLSCNPCRSRKVKIAGICQYDLTETERQPILQAEALKEKDKAIAHLRNELQRLQSQPHVKMEPRDDDLSMNSHPRMPVPPSNIRQRRHRTVVVNDSIYFGAPATSSVMEEFANLSVNGKPANLTHLVPRGTDMAAFQVQPANPFPTAWRMTDPPSTIAELLPKDEQEIYFHLHAFQGRAQSFSFPYMPAECTKAEVQRFLMNRKENSDHHPGMLALLFAVLAQGIQHGVYDKYGHTWHAGSMEMECETSNAFIAASMQCLRLASYRSRPTLLMVETLVMIGPYLTNSGRFLDAWALFGTTIRLAQSIGRMSDRLNPPIPAEEAAARRSLWWWIMHMDQQYSITLGRPLGISSMGDCPPPEPLMPGPVFQSLSNYMAQFTILTRQILSAGHLTAHQIDDFTEQLFALQHTLPSIVQFDDSWLNVDKPVPGWPMDLQAATIHAKTHTYVLLLNRQRTSDERVLPKDSNATVNYSSRGRQRVIRSCRAVLRAFDFFHTRVPAGLVCWATAQQAFNAAMLLVHAMLETNDATDLETVQRAYSTFLEMQRLGIHRLAEAAVDRLGGLIKDIPSGHPLQEAVMGQSGMLLLEDPGLQGFMDGGFSPLTFQKPGTAQQADRPRKQRRMTHSHREHEDVEVKQEGPLRGPKSYSQRKSHVGRGTNKSRSVAMTKTNSKSSRPTMHQRHSGLPSPSMTEPSDRMQVPSDWSLDPSSLDSAAMPQQPTRISPPLVSPNQQMFQAFPANDFDSQAQMQHHSQGFNPVTRAQATFPDDHSESPHHHQPSSDPSIQHSTYATQMTPHNLTPTALTPTDMVHTVFQSAPRLDFAAYTHYPQSQMHQQTPMHTPPFSATFPPSEIPCSYPIAGGREIASSINELLSMPFTLRIATRDSHPSNHISFSTSHPPPNNKAFESKTEVVNPKNPAESMSIPIWPVHCVQGTPGAEIIPELDQSRLDRIIDKGRDKQVEMFSAFADSFGNKTSTAASFDLASFLKENGIGQVFVVGLTGDYCVRCTAIDAHKEGFEVFVIEEAVKSVDSGANGWGSVKAELQGLGVGVISIAGPEPKLREEVKEDVKNETNKDGSGKGQMAAWKGAKIAKEYEKKGGDYENEAGSKNEPSKGAPEPKSAEEKKDETKTDAVEKKDDKKEEKEKPKANSAKKATGKKAETKAKAPKKDKKTPTEGTRKSTRISGKRSAPEDDKKTEEKAPAKKVKTAKK
ncbi:MAG: hypothetical protein Q9212_001744 [Teloschistes hypoglaucus]